MLRIVFRLLLAAGMAAVSAASICAQSVEMLPMPEKVGRFQRYQIRTPLLTVEGVDVLGTSPPADAATIAEFKKYICCNEFGPTIDVLPERSHRVVAKHEIRRIQIGDDQIAGYHQNGPKEIAVVGKAIGSTVLNFWCVDEMGKEHVESYLVRVWLDPETSFRRQEAQRAARLIGNGIDAAIIASPVTWSWQLR